MFKNSFHRLDTENRKKMHNFWNFAHTKFNTKHVQKHYLYVRSHCLRWIILLLITHKSMIRNLTVYHFSRKKKEKISLPFCILVVIRRFLYWLTIGESIILLHLWISEPSSCHSNHWHVQPSTHMQTQTSSN